MLATAALLAFSAGAAWGGFRAAAGPKRRSAALCLAALLLVLGKVAGAFVPVLEARLFPFDFYPFIEAWWCAVPTLFLLSAGLYTVRRSLWKRDAILIAAGLFLSYWIPLAWTTGEGHENLFGEVTDAEVCPQTSGYSCGPASAATLLHKLGVRASEREMARLCVTRSWMWGTSSCGLLRGLRRKLPGRRVSIASPPVGEIPVPSLVNILLRPQLGHCVVLESVSEDQVGLIDPLCGRRRMTRREFEEAWMGEAIYVEPQLPEQGRAPAGHSASR